MQRLEEQTKSLLDLPYDLLELIFLASSVNSLASFSMTSEKAADLTSIFIGRLKNPHFLLKIFSALPPREIACLVQAYFSPTSSMFASIKNAAGQRANHEAMICYMLMTPEVGSLNKEDSYRALKWLEGSREPYLEIIKKDILNQKAFFQNEWSDMECEQDPPFLNASGNKSILADLNKKNLSDGLFRHVAFSVPRFNESDLVRSCFIDSRLDWASFINANLTEADFRRAKLQFCVFRNAILKDANFIDTIILAGDYTGANLDGVKFIPSSDYSDVDRFKNRLTFIYEHLKDHQNFSEFRGAVLKDILSHVEKYKKKNELLNIAYEHRLFSAHRHLTGLRYFVNTTIHFLKNDSSKIPSCDFVETESQRRIKNGL